MARARKLEELDAKMDPEALAEAKERVRLELKAYDAWQEELRTGNIGEPGEEVGAEERFRI